MPPPRGCRRVAHVSPGLRDVGRLPAQAFNQSVGKP